MTLRYDPSGYVMDEVSGSVPGSGCRLRLPRTGKVSSVVHTAYPLDISLLSPPITFSPAVDPSLFGRQARS
jgi:hypothetical protein